MGSQDCWHTRVNAPAAIVVKALDGFRIAERGGAWQPDRDGGGHGPVVVTYTLAPGLPYRTEAEAQVDAALILKRS